MTDAANTAKPPVLSATQASGTDQPHAQAPRPMLRLSSILASLCGPEGAQAMTTASAGPVAASTDQPPTPEVASTRQARRRSRKKTRVPSFLTIGEIVERTSHAGFGFILAFLALVSVPFFGLSTPFGLAITFVALQMVIGLKRPWLPRTINRRHVSISVLNWMSTRLARWTAGLERIIRPRFTVVVRGPFWMVCGLAVMAQGLGLALPLPIPGSNWLFILPVLIYAIGLLEDDGLLIMVGHCIMAIEVVFVIRAWSAIAEAIRNFDAPWI